MEAMKERLGLAIFTFGKSTRKHKTMIQFQLTLRESAHCPVPMSGIRLTKGGTCGEERI